MDRKRANRTFDIEHIIPLAKAKAEEDFGEGEDFQALYYIDRDRIGGLLLLPRGKNRSLKNMATSEKYSRYAGGNVLAQTLVQNFYKNNPQLDEFVERSSLTLGPIDAFDPDIIKKRGSLYRSVAEKIWSKDILEE